MAEGRPAPPTSRLTVGNLTRLIFPRRSRLGWGMAIGTGWALAGTFYSLALSEVIGGEWVLLLAFGLVSLLPAALPIYAGLYGPVALAGDRATGLLDGLRLTLVDGLTLLRAYHRRTVVAGMLLYAALVPCWLILGRAPHPLIFSPYMLWCQLDNSWALAAPRFLSGALSDAATISLAASLGLGAMVWMRSRAWAVILGPLGALLFGAAGSGLGWGMLLGADALGLEYYRSAWIAGDPAEPGYTLLLWTFSVVYSTAAFLTGRAALGAAARRLDRLVTD